MKIKITTEDFRNATEYVDNNTCPLATAIKRQLDVNDVSVSIGCVNIRKKFYRVNWDWCSEQKVYGGEYEGMTIDEMIDLAKSNPDIEFPELELKLFKD